MVIMYCHHHSRYRALAWALHYSLLVRTADTSGVNQMLVNPVYTQKERKEKNIASQDNSKQCPNTKPLKDIVSLLL